MMYEFGPCAFDAQARELFCGGRRIKLQPKTLDVLEYLLERPGRLVGRDELVQALWPDEPVHENNLTQHVFLLRRALAAHAPQLQAILTVSGRGYRVVVPVEVRSSVRLLESPAWRWYARGRILAERASRESLAEAVQCFERALHADPSLADAHAGLAHARIARALRGVLGAAHEFADAETAARAALALEPEHPEANAALGDAALLYRYDFRRALDAYRAALRYGAQRPRIWTGRAAVFSALARHAAARHDLERALQLNPVSVDVLAAYGWVDFYAGNARAAMERFSDVLQIDERAEAAACGLAASYALHGRHDDVRALRAAFHGGARTEEFAAAYGVACAAAGDEAAAVRTLAELRSRVLRAQVRCALRQSDDAMRELSAGIALRDPLCAHAGVHPFFEALRVRRDFQESIAALAAGAYSPGDGDELQLACRSR